MWFDHRIENISGASVSGRDADASARVAFHEFGYFGYRSQVRIAVDRMLEARSRYRKV